MSLGLVVAVDVARVNERRFAAIVMWFLVYGNVYKYWISSTSERFSSATSRDLN